MVLDHKNGYLVDEPIKTVSTNVRFFNIYRGTAQNGFLRYAVFEAICGCIACRM
jgi:hypothetical protein